MTRLLLCTAALFALAPAASAQAPDGGVTFESRLKNDVNGYVVEARIPWRLVRTTPADGLVVGFDVHVNDDDEGGEARRHKLVWSGSPGDEQHKDPRTFGAVVLGADRDGLTGVPLAAPPAVDGEREAAWDGAAALPLAHVRLSEAMPAPNDLSATAYALYDAEALYLLVDVVDNRVVVDTDARVHLDDGIEVYLDGGHERAEMYDANDLKLALRPGRSSADLTALALDAQYPGREPDAAWRRLAETRIDALRKAPLRVVVEDAEGRPVEGAEVHVEMRRHAFEFGAALDARLLVVDEPAARRYQEHVERLYNTAVFGNAFKWERWTLSQTEEHARWRASWTGQAVQWLNRRDVKLRGHYVLWSPVHRHSTLPDSLVDLVGHPDRLRRAWLANIRQRVPALIALGEIPEWDAINHITGWGPTTTNVLGPDFNAEVMALAREITPDAEHWVNEGNVLTSRSRVEAYERDILDLVERGAAPDGIGFMGHFATGTFTPPDTLYALFDRFARIVPRLKLTELDVQTPDEALQADYLRDVMTMAFSHPAVEGIVMWGFWEGQHWRPQAALYREDWTPKPAAEAWEQLVLGDWWTDETVQTDPDGTARLRAFLGEHAVTVRHGDREARQPATLTRDGETLTVRLAGDTGRQRGTR